MERLETIHALNELLLEEMPQYREQAAAFPADVASQRRLLRSLMNVRPPMPISSAFLELQDALLSAEQKEKAWWMPCPCRLQKRIPAWCCGGETSPG